MAAPEPKSIPEVVGELKELTISYAKQETIDPLKRIGRMLGFGVAGAVLIGLGTTFLVIGALRAMQTQTGRHLTGSYTWVPYLATLLACAVVIALLVRAITKTAKKSKA